MTQWREIVIVALIAALCFATYQCDRNKGKLKDADAAKKRMENISTVQAVRKGVQSREQNLYPAIHQALGDLGKKRAGVKRAESELPPVQTKKEITHEVENTTQGNINRLADLFRADGYNCSVVER